MPMVHTSNSIDEWYPAKTAGRISGLSEDMINYLCRYGIVVPSGGKKRGRGTARKYTYTDLLLLKAITKLLGQGISVLRLRRSLVALQQRDSAREYILTKKYVLTDGYDVYFADNASFESLETGQMTFAFVLELASLRKEVEATIARKAA